jgi:crossover junction endodeoxyribonuclease RusA
VILLKKFKISVPIPPSINHCYWYRAGKRIKSTMAKNYCNALIEQTNKLMKKLKFKQFEEKKMIRCNMKYYFPDNRNRDTHNTFKLLFDAIEDGGLYKNDRYVLPHVEPFEVDRENPRLELEFYYE